MSVYRTVNQILSPNRPSVNFTPEAPVLIPTATSPCSELRVVVENVVASADLKQRLNLDVVLSVSSGARYNPERFPGLIYRLKRPKSTLLLFSSGKVVCTGAKSVRSASTAIINTINQLSDSGIVIITKPTPQIENIVASTNLQGAVDLENAAQQLHRTIYDPEQFPGLIYRANDPRSVFLIFTNGKTISTGTKTTTDLHQAVHNLQTVLQNNHLITYNNRPQANKQGLPIIVEQVQHVR